MRDPANWYEIVEGPELLQGDFVSDCPVASLQDGITLADLERAEREGGGAPIRVETANVVVMNQSCDLAQGKVQQVLVCRHYSLDELSEMEPKFANKGLRENIRKGHVAAYHMLAECSIEGHERSIQVVVFQEPGGVPFTFLSSFAAASGPRVRLVPPYREHLSQAFARFFMRVGLPADIPPF